MHLERAAAESQRALVRELDGLIASVSAATAECEALAHVLEALKHQPPGAPSAG